MKLSQFRRFIKEEVKKVVKEAYNLPTQTTPEQFIQAVSEILPDLRKRVDVAVKAVKVSYVDDTAQQHPHGNLIKVEYEGIQESNRLADAYNKIVQYLGAYQRNPSDRFEKVIRKTLESVK